MTERAPAPPPGADYPPDFWGWVDAAAGRCTTEQVGTLKAAPQQQPSAEPQPTVASDVIELRGKLDELRDSLLAAKGIAAKRALVYEFAAAFAPRALAELDRIGHDPAVEAEDRIKALLAIVERSAPIPKEPAVTIGQPVSVALTFDLGNRFGRLADQPLTLNADAGEQPKPEPKP